MQNFVHFHLITLVSQQYFGHHLVTDYYITQFIRAFMIHRKSKLSLVYALVWYFTLLIRLFILGLFALIPLNR